MANNPAGQVTSTISHDRHKLARTAPDKDVRVRHAADPDLRIQMDPHTLDTRH